MYVLPYFLGFLFHIPLVYTLYNLYIVKTGTEIDAVVIRTAKECDAEGGWIYIPVFEYYFDGKRFETKYRGGNYKQKYLDGSIVQIYCHTKNPKVIVSLNDEIVRIVISIICAIIGVILIFTKPLLLLLGV